VVPLLDHSLPDDPTEPSWYVMPLAVPLRTALGTGPALSTVVGAIERVGRTLTGLVTEGVSHRDIKPDNLFRLDDDWAVGDFGLVKYPEQEAVTRQGRPLGPYYFMAPEMRQNADTANAELADVYSLAKTLWAVAAGRPDPPPGELRRDRSGLRLSSYVSDERASHLEGLLERSTSHDPSSRPAMREFAEELNWWAEPEVRIQSDLSAYAEEVSRLRVATATTRQETERQRLERLYNEAGGQVYSDLTAPLVAKIKETGLRLAGSPPSTIEGWPPVNYGGSAQQPCWEIETLSCPWLAASIGVVHRAVPAEDLEDLAVTVVIARMTPGSQHTYLTDFQQFRPGSLRLNQIIAELRARIENALPGMIADFLSSAKQTGRPRNEATGWERSPVTNDGAARLAAQALAESRKPRITADVRNEPHGADGSLRGTALVINRSQHEAANVEVEVHFRGERGTKTGSVRRLLPFDSDESNIWYLDLGPELSHEEATSWRGIERIVVRYSDSEGFARWEQTESWPPVQDEPSARAGRRFTDRLISRE